MQLKRCLVGLREPARGPGGSRKPHGSAGLVGGSRVGPALPRGAGQRRLPSTGARQFGGDRGERCGPSHAAARADSGRLRPHVGRSPAREHCVQCPGTAETPRSGRCDISCRGCWRPNGCIRPVLKHGPRSATCTRVFGWQTPRCSESVSGTRSRLGENLGPPGRRRFVDRSRSTPWWDLSESVPVATRKMVNYA